MMNKPAMPTTIAICCRLPPSADAGLVEEWVRAARTARLAVTWVVGVDGLRETVMRLGDRLEADTLALDVPAEWGSGTGSTSLDRQRLSAVRRSAPSLDALVLQGVATASRMRSDLMVEHGIRIVACDQPRRTDARRSRRPSPSGWACHSPTWGLWEVGITSKTALGLLGRVLPFSLGPALPSGSLSILRTGYVAGRSKRDCRQDYDRILHWVARRCASRPDDTACVTLSELATMLNRGTACTGPRSVLAA